MLNRYDVHLAALAPTLATGRYLQAIVEHAIRGLDGMGRLSWNTASFPKPCPIC